MSEIGIVGLGVMGAALALNFASKGHDVQGYDVAPDGARRLAERAAREGLDARIAPHADLAAMMGALSRPRAVLVMVPDRFVDDALESLRPFLEEGDVVIDGGNTDFGDTIRREKDFAARGLNFVGMGVSGGEEGARNGPSMMVGGTKAAWDRLDEMLRSIAARYEGDPCVDRLGPDGAGHFVKTVHNGIEYADMQMIADVYGILRDGGGMSPYDIAPVFRRWNEGPLQSYLVEITGEVLAATDRTGKPAVDVILGRAGQKGTGRWTLIEALKLGQSASAIEAAVAARSWSAQLELRRAAKAAIDVPAEPAEMPGLEVLEQALLTAKIIAYDQGIHLLGAASDHFDWRLDIARIAEIWRAGCIIRAAMLNEIAGAVRGGLPHGSLVLAEPFTTRIREGLPALRRTVTAAMSAGIAVPALSSSLDYLETLRRGRGTADLIQAQRDFFGRHGFERRDMEGTDHHGPWWDDHDAVPSDQPAGEPE
ncbi:6-phosphogluconate dehydrogenase [Hasllibacter halocynthiae]|uniref:6-phosphogluconate dehydrogenase, decarboxylating n=1 Tax=Hasllibacter halocynthiae TaxID=595589 RepID=A0A2T0X473_9RHOB|nr:NADP-dependent phosphogluconate dehydrogenase [Hasllibacter halocynthiae]PRY93717.1 6-phosphogluconate dehydrogenase [Hasllibacter halocynthiae]